MIAIIYILVFAIGTLIGSFCTLAVYRLPLRKDITHERSFCPKCNHKLNFLDLIPILSYVFLRGKCRYCHEKIRPRYLILEICSGLIAVIYALSFGFTFRSFEIDKLITLVFGLLYITGLTIILGIDKEKKQIQRSVLLFNIIVSFTYIIYLFIVGVTNVNRYAIYLFFMLALICIDLLDKKFTNKRKTPIVFYICILNIILMILENFSLFYL